MAFCLGVNVTLKHFPDKRYKYYLSYLKQKGFTHLRLELDCLEPVSFSELQQFCAVAKQEGFFLLGVITPLVEASLKHMFFPPKRISDTQYLDYVKEVQVQLPLIDMFEIWNEQNTKRFWGDEPSFDSYYTLVQKVKPLLEKPFLLGSICGNDSDSLATTKPRYLPKKLHEPIGFHPYVFECYLNLFRSKEWYVKTICNRIDTFIEKYPHSWITEFGISRSWTFLSQKKISYIYQNIIRHCQKKHIPFFIWHMFDFKVGKNYMFANPETTFGLFTTKGKPHYFLENIIIN